MGYYTKNMYFCKGKQSKADVSFTFAVGPSADPAAVLLCDFMIKKMIEGLSKCVGRWYDMIENTGMPVKEGGCSW